MYSMGWKLHPTTYIIIVLQKAEINLMSVKALNIIADLTERMPYFPMLRSLGRRHGQYIKYKKIMRSYSDLV